MDDLDFFDSDEFFGDESFIDFEPPRKSKRGQARQRYERLMEEKRLKQQLDDEIGYW